MSSSQRVDTQKLLLNEIKRLREELANTIDDRNALSTKFGQLNDQSQKLLVENAQHEKDVIQMKQTIHKLECHGNLLQTKVDLLKNGPNYNPVKISPSQIQHQSQHKEMSTEIQQILSTNNDKIVTRFHTYDGARNTFEETKPIDDEIVKIDCGLSSQQNAMEKNSRLNILYKNVLNDVDFDLLKKNFIPGASYGSLISLLRDAFAFFTLQNKVLLKKKKGYEELESKSKHYVQRSSYCCYYCNDLLLSFKFIYDDSSYKITTLASEDHICNIDKITKVAIDLHKRKIQDVVARSNIPGRYKTDALDKWS